MTSVRQAAFLLTRQTWHVCFGVTACLQPTRGAVCAFSHVALRVRDYDATANAMRWLIWCAMRWTRRLRRSRRADSLLPSVDPRPAPALPLWFSKSHASPAGLPPTGRDGFFELLGGDTEMPDMETLSSQILRERATKEVRC